jgi:hypothetical protein
MRGDNENTGGMFTFVTRRSWSRRTIRFDLFGS